MNENTWNFTFPESFLKAMEELNKVQLSVSAMAMSQAWKAAVPKYELSGIYAALNEIVARQKEWEKLVAQANSFSTMAKSMIPVLEQIDTSTLTDFQESVSMTALTKADWSWLSEVYSEWDSVEGDKQEDSPEYTAAEVVTPEICAQIESDVSQMLSRPEQAQETFQRRYAKWKEENPFLADLYMLLLLPILVYFLCQGGDAVIARLSKDASVYEEPSTKSNLVINISGDQNVTIIGDTTDYYEIEFVNPKTGGLETGYIDKENIVTEEPDDTEANEDATEVTEESEPSPVATGSQMEPSE